MIDCTYDRDLIVVEPTSPLEIDTNSFSIDVACHGEGTSYIEVYNNGEMSRWPLSFIESLPLAKFALLAKWGKDKLIASPDESLWDWGCRLLGSSVTENLLEPGMQGVYATESKNLDAQLILDSIKKRPKKM